MPYMSGYSLGYICATNCFVTLVTIAAVSLFEEKRTPLDRIIKLRTSLDSFDLHSPDEMNIVMGELVKQME